MTEEKELKPLSKVNQKILDEYLICFNQWKAYKKGHPKVTDESARTLSSRLFADVDFSAHLTARLNEVHMSADEAMKLQSDLAHVDVGFFFKPIDEWVFHPLPSYEILDEREVIDDTKDPPEKRISYRVRHVALDMDKIQDPRYSWMIKSFSDSSKFGLKIETYDRQAAIANILKLHGKFTDKVDLTSNGETLKPDKGIDDATFERAITTLAAALREVIPATDSGQNSDVGTAK